MHKRQFLTGSAALLAWYMAGSAQATSAAVDHKTKLVVADQSELIRHLLDASGERKTLPFQLELPNFAGGPAIFEAMRAGALDIAYVGDTPPIQARAAGVHLPIIATFSRELAQYRLLQQANAGVERLSDLRGKRVSYVEGSGRQVFLIEALNRAGLTLKDVQPVHLRVSELNDALRAKAVDVAVITEPHVSRLSKQIGARLVPDPQERKLLPSTSYLYARPEVLADPQKTQAIAQFLAAFVRAGNWSNANEATWGEHYYRKFQRLDAQTTAAIQTSLSPLIFETAAEAQPLHQRLIDTLYAAGSLPQRLDAKDSFVTTFDSVVTTTRRQAPAKN
ncbi:ABC transporter substrate-binding protein [Comamonas kerstersii]|uniref:ABC transporter substrate-binding protein n=1 Tax=Comamonas kerstersii TaxID=225992 RepID=UPI001B337DF6|nr:ABC transporter substrate-binding protein [Comamonas kerstersii]QTW18836.1 ABC transporter substrate-binding protein [Comamonas kerstersii]